MTSREAMARIFGYLFGGVYGWAASMAGMPFWVMLVCVVVSGIAVTGIVAKIRADA